MESPSSGRRQRALVTGSDGFTGAYVKRELEAAGYDVVGMSRSAGAGASGVLPVDLLDRDGLRQAVEQARADIVIHLAAIAFVAHGDVDSMYRVNVVGTRNLLEALADSPRLPRIVVLASSANIYGNATEEPIGEATPPAPANDYAVSKLAMEYMARLWMDRLPIVLARPFNYTGVGQDDLFLIPKIVRHFQRREPEIELGNIQVWRDFSDVRWVATAYRTLVERAAPGGIFNLCSGEPFSIEQVLAEMATLAGYAIKVRVNPAFVRNNEVKRLVGDPSRFDGLGSPDGRIPMSDTLRWMYLDGLP